MKCPRCVSNPTEDKVMLNRVQSRHKMVNVQLKHSEILKSMDRHDQKEYWNVFWAITAITQLSINAGERIFEVDDYTEL